jgi:hypothetical protein
MKKQLALLMSFLVIIVGCRKEKGINVVELYGNTFIHLEYDNFRAPKNWNKHELFNRKIQVQLPPYMQQTETRSSDGYECAIFMYEDSLGRNHPYGRISIDYYYDPLGRFSKADEYIGYKKQLSIMKPIVESALKGIQSPYVSVPDGEILNGPHYDSHSFVNSGCFYVYDAYYRRKDYNKDEGPVSCHIFYMMNKTEAVLMTVSYHDKDSVLFNNLFNTIQTFTWSDIKR